MASVGGHAGCVGWRIHQRQTHDEFGTFAGDAGTEDADLAAMALDHLVHQVEADAEAAVGRGVGMRALREQLENVLDLVRSDAATGVVDVQFGMVALPCEGDAHATAHALQDAIRERVRGADVLIHLEPEANVHPGTELEPR